MTTGVRSRPRVWLSWAGLCLLVVVAVFAVALAVRGGPTAAADRHIYSTVKPQGSRPLAVFLGDDYSTSSAVAKGAQSWVQQLAGSEKWKIENLAKTGSGFLARPDASSCSGGSCSNLLEQVPQVVAAAPQVVVVSAGEADLSGDLSAVAKRINAVLMSLRVGVPDATVVAVGPSSPRVTPPPDVLALDGAMRAAAAANGAHYVSLLAPNVLTAQDVNGKGVLDATGHAAIAVRVRATLLAS